MSRTLRILHVDDDPSFGDLVATFLEREDEAFAVTTATSVAEGLEYLAEGRPDCIVSDYEMPERDGLAFLERVRETHPDLPFILYTGKGSEEVASEALSAGATDYLQKGPGTEQYTLLANRIRNAVERERSQSALERERSRMQFALESTTAAVWTRRVSTDEMEIYPTTCPVFGAPIECLQDFLDEVHPADRDATEREIRIAARSGETYSIQFRFTRDGDLRWGEMSGRTLRGDGPETMQTGITREITEEKERERRFETLVRNLPGIVYRCRQTPGWPMIDVRGDVESITGYSAAALESGAVSWGDDVIHPDDRDEIWERVDGAPAEAESFELTYRIVTDDDAVRWVWERGRRVSTADDHPAILEGVIDDVTTHKRQEEALKRNERRFEALFDDPNLLVALLDCDGVVRDVNTTALRYVDADRAAVVGECFWDTPWWGPEQATSLEAWIERANAGEYVEYGATHTNPDGSTVPVSGVIRPVVDDSGTVCSLIASAREVSGN